MRYEFNIRPEPFEFETDIDDTAAPFGKFETLNVALPGRTLTYTTRDVIDRRISVPAQHSLVRLSKNPATSVDAVALLAEVKAGRLGGIFCVNWQKPAQRATRLGKSWWTVIPPVEDAVVMLDPDNPLGGQPLIAFRRELDPDCGRLRGEKRSAPSPERLDAALLKVWTSYRLWQTGQQPDQLAKCTVMTAEDLKSAGLRARGLPSATPLSNVVPSLSCQISKEKLCKAFCELLGKSVADSCRKANNCPPVKPGDLPDDCHAHCFLEGEQAAEECKKKKGCPDEATEQGGGADAAARPRRPVPARARLLRAGIRSQERR